MDLQTEDTLIHVQWAERLAYNGKLESTEEGDDIVLFPGEATLQQVRNCCLELSIESFVYLGATMLFRVILKHAFQPWADSATNTGLTLW